MFVRLMFAKVFLQEWLSRSGSIRRQEAPAIQTLSGFYNRGIIMRSMHSSSFLYAVRLLILYGALLAPLHELRKHNLLKCKPNLRFCVYIQVYTFMYDSTHSRFKDAGFCRSQR